MADTKRIVLLLALAMIVVPAQAAEKNKPKPQAAAKSYLEKMRPVVESFCKRQAQIAVTAFGVSDLGDGDINVRMRKFYDDVRIPERGKEYDSLLRSLIDIGVHSPSNVVAYEAGLEFCLERVVD